MRQSQKTMRDWAVPIIVAAGTVFVLEGANVLRTGLGLAVAAVVVVGGVVALVFIGRRKG